MISRLTYHDIYRGGEEVLLDVGGQDATEAFEDVGHSDEAREILDGMLVGTLKRQVIALLFPVRLRCSLRLPIASISFSRFFDQSKMENYAAMLQPINLRRAAAERVLVLEEHVC